MKLQTHREITLLGNILGRSRWPRGLRRGPVVAVLLGLRFRIPPDHGYLSLVNIVCCQVQVFAMGRSLVQRSLTEFMCVCVCH
jgi:hypothetical protein